MGTRLLQKSKWEWLTAYFVSVSPGSTVYTWLLSINQPLIFCKGCCGYLDCMLIFEHDFRI